MGKEKLFKALDGLFAYDTGCTDSGVRGEDLKSEIKICLNSLSENDFRLLLSEFIRDYYLSNEALNEGYGIEDVKSFIDWLDYKLDIQF